MAVLLKPAALLKIEHRLASGTLQIPFMGEVVKSYRYQYRVYRPSNLKNYRVKFLSKKLNRTFLFFSYQHRTRSPAIRTKFRAKICVPGSLHHYAQKRELRRVTTCANICANIMKYHVNQFQSIIKSFFIFFVFCQWGSWITTTINGRCST